MDGGKMGSEAQVRDEEWKARHGSMRNERSGMRNEKSTISSSTFGHFSLLMGGGFCQQSFVFTIQVRLCNKSLSTICPCSSHTTCCFG